MKKQATCGQASISFETPVYIESCSSVVSQKEGEGPLSHCFDLIEPDPMFGTDTWEAAESIMQTKAAQLAIKKAGLDARELRMVFAGDLLAQSTASSFGIAGIGVPFYGLYGACSTMGEALSLGAMAIAGGYGSHILCATSSHFASAEKEFRFPLSYGNQRPLSATWTVTGSGACILGAKPPALPATDSPKGFAPLRSSKDCLIISGITTGKLVDYGLKDSMNMGACMAPAACDTISQHLMDFGRTPTDYDCIITGDLGLVGKKILLDLLTQKGIDIQNCYEDCGLLIFDSQTQDTHAGGSGCGCSATVLAAHLLPKVLSGEWKRILFIPTGALLSKVSFNEGDSVPGIAHAVVIEHYQLTDVS